MRLSLLIASLFTRREQRAVVWLILLLIALSSALVFFESPCRRERSEVRNLLLTDSLSALLFKQPDSLKSNFLQTNHPSRRERYTVPEMIDMNRADSSQFARLPGIGAVLSKRIVKYRDLLGGFYDIRQLLEVYGIDSHLYRRCLPFLRTDTLNLAKLDPNNDSFSRFLRHPYLEVADVERLFRFRRQHGFIGSLYDIRHHIWGDSLFGVMRPYIEITPLTEKERGAK